MTKGEEIIGKFNSENSTDVEQASMQAVKSLFI